MDFFYGIQNCDRLYLKQNNYIVIYIATVK